MSMKDKMRIPKDQEAKVRKEWDFNPATRVIPAGKNYRRSKDKKNWQKEARGYIG